MHQKHVHDLDQMCHNATVTIICGLSSGRWNVGGNGQNTLHDAAPHNVEVLLCDSVLDLQEPTG
jgi:hypothetical protein